MVESSVPTMYLQGYRLQQRNQTMKDNLEKQHKFTGFHIKAVLILSGTPPRLYEENA